MKTDTLFHQLFQTFHSLLFELIEQPVSMAEGYEFGSVETVLVYKFPQLSRKEIEAMFTLDDLKQTRVYQEAKEEGMQQGMQQGMQEALRKTILRLLLRKFRQITPELKSQIETLAIPQLENLTEAVLDFTSTGDLEIWLRGNA
jgi:predicted transposase YdaD